MKISKYSLLSRTFFPIVTICTGFEKDYCLSKYGYEIAKKKKAIVGNIVYVIRKQDCTDRLLFLIRFGSKF